MERRPFPDVPIYFEPGHVPGDTPMLERLVSDKPEGASRPGLPLQSVLAPDEEVDADNSVLERRRMRREDARPGEEVVGRCRVGRSLGISSITC